MKKIIFLLLPLLLLGAGCDTVSGSPMRVCVEKECEIWTHAAPDTSRPCISNNDTGKEICGNYTSEKVEATYK